MLKLFPGYFLLLGLACQFGHAQRSGGGFSILSESTGPLVAEGNTSTTGFSQIGASEAIQGTFSTATSGFSGTIGFLASQPLNTLPTDLNFTAPLTIAENQPIGTIVGDFNATDPDAGASLTYYLVSSTGDGNNSLFTLETNGTLKTATTFDYETNASTYTIRVQAKDEFNATVEGNFTVVLTDVSYEPSQPPHSVQSAANLEMIWVEPGTFTMGSPVGEPDRNSYENEHNVTLTKGFYLGKYEVTQAQYQAVMTGNSNGLSATPSQYSGNPNRPVEKVSWNDAQIFLTRLNDAEQTAGRLPGGWSYFLPTESQWEYACRAGTTTAYSWGATIASSNANYLDSGIGQTADVGQYSANPWGFFDMHGNVWEWTADWYGNYPTGPLTDPTGATSGSSRVIRGSSWNYLGPNLRSSKRGIFGQSSRDFALGFRVGFQQINNNPTGLNSAAPLTFAENQPIGTPIGKFNATDPDAGATLTYYLVSGTGDGNNTLFTLETNGTLKTATTFDYESNASTYSIRVQAKDEFNATVEGNFTVTLLDLYELNYDKDSFQSTINNLPNLNVSEVFVSGNSSSLNLIGSISIPNTLEVNIQSRGDLIISGSLSMNSGQDLILEAGGDIYINGGIFSKEDSGRLFLKFGLNSTNENNPNDYFINSPVNLPDGQNLLIKQGKDGNLTTYTVLTELGVQNSLTGIDLQGVKGNLSANYALGADLNASATISWNGGSGFEPIGTASTPFSGNFEGLGHTIENLHIQRTSIDKVALFGRTFGSKISNLGVVNANIRGKREVSALIASSSNSLVSRCFSSGTVNGADENVAGLIAGIHGSTVINSYSHANATGTMYDVGGLGGELGSATIQNCYSTGKPQGGSRVGGLVGVTFSASQIQNSFWDKQTSSRTTWGIDYHGVSSVAAIGLTTIEMKSQTRFLNAGWDFNNTWVMPENDYPILRWQIRNSPPANLNSTTPLTFAENQPVGTTIAEFNATDPDAGATLTYYLVSGAGDGNNSLFTLETNGTLKTATTFDYETNASTYSIRVQAKDEFNATVEGNFTVVLTDVYEPSQANHFVDLNSTVNLEMIWVEPGTFTMGSPTSEAGRLSNETEHNVTLTKGFYLGKYELTQAQYEAVMTGNSNSLGATPSGWPGNPNRPVEMVSWDDVQIFLTRLNAAEQAAGRLPTGWSYVLPTESQWEYACRAGTTTAYSWGATISSSNANYLDSGIGQTADVGQYAANPWGFFDMHGNVWEWTVSRILRGGSWSRDGGGLRSAKRNGQTPSHRDNILGFRVGFQQANTQPTDLNTTAPLTFAENQPIGTPIGEFNATDPDAGATLTYHLVSGVGDTHNSLFTLETNGTLKTATTFDYESNASTYSIRVQAKDEHNATVEGNFTVVLTDDVNEDTDGDGFTDAEEALAGTLPTDPASKPGLDFGLVAWYPFDGNASDMSGNGNTGTVNGATLSTDRHGQENKAYRFDGVDDWIEVNHHPSIDFDTADSFTLSLWLKFGIGNTNYRSIIEKWSGLGGYSYVLRHSDTSHIYFNRHDGSSADRLDIIEDEFPQVFQHVLVKSNGTRLSLFLNLVHKESVSISTGSTSNTSNLYFGKRGGSSTYNFSGSIDDIRIYDRALSASEVAALYQMESALPVGSVTTAKLDLGLHKFLDGNDTIEQVLPAGSVIAVKPGDPAPAGYTLFQRNEYNATLTWEEKAPVSVARYAYDGVETLGGKIYFLGGGEIGTAYNLTGRYDPATNQWESLNQMSEARVGMASAVLGGKLYAIGGSILSSVEIFDPQTAQWSTGTQLPDATYHAGAITVNGKILLLGGKNSNQQITGQVLEFDPATNQWSQKTPMPTPRHGLKTVLLNGKVWAIGGQDAVGDSNKTEIYDPVQDSWSAGPATGSPRHWPLAWLFDDRIYLAGGANGSNRLNSIEVFNPITNQWVASGILPENKFVGDATVLGGKVYIVAGDRSSNDYTNKVYAANLPAPAMHLYFKDGNATAETATSPALDGNVTLNMLAPDALAKLDVNRTHAQSAGSVIAIPRGSQPPPGYSLYKRSDRNGSLVWEEKAPLSQSRTFLGSMLQESINGSIYAIGGHISPTTSFNILESYDPITNQWIIRKNLNETSFGQATTSLNGKIYSIGGYDLSKVEIYDPRLDFWSAGIPIPVETRYGSAATIDGKIFFMGGRKSPATILNKVYAFDPSLNSWTEVSSMTISRAAHRSVVFQNQIWTIGGSNDGARLNSVEVYDHVTDTWTAGPSLINPRYGFSTWVSSGKIYVAGGKNDSGFLNSIECFDPSEGSWLEIGQLPEAKHSASATVHNGKVFVFGGEISPDIYSDKVFAADVTPPMDLYFRDTDANGTVTLDKLDGAVVSKLDGNASALPPLGVVSAIDHNDQPPAGHRNLERTDRNAAHEWVEMAATGQKKYGSDGVDTLGDKIIFAGGRVRPAFAPTSYVGTFDPTTNQWSQVASMSVARQGVCSATIDGKFYVFGGSDGTNSLKSVEIYDPETNQWTAGPEMPEPLHMSFALAVNGEIFLIGGTIGNTAGTAYSDNVYVYSPALGLWRELPSMVNARAYCRAVFLENQIWVIGGIDDSGILTSVEIFDIHSQTWSVGPSLSIPKAAPVAWVSGGRIYIGGGTKGPNVFSNSIERFNPGINDWEPFGNIQENVSSKGFAVLDNKIFIAGGQLDGDASNKVYTADLLPHRDLYFRSTASEAVNREPTSVFAVGDLNIAENQPIGTPIGEFNATDPDAGATLTYHLVSGAGDGNNTLFTLEANGTLKTATTFDFESNASTYSIRVQAKDEFNATVEGNFTVTLIDVSYEPSQPNHTVDLNASVNLEMIWVEPGTFTMGSPVGEANRGTDETEHNVTLTKGFYLGKYEVTQAQYEAVMTGNGNGLSASPSNWPNNPNRPVEQVSWDDVQIFLTRLNANEQAAGRLPAGWSYVLPTESQWEYACRAGTTTVYSWGATIASSNANYLDSGIGQTADVGQYAANTWGFFDMHGSVWEWTADRYGTYPTGNPVIDPPGAASGSTRVGRGGSWGTGGTSLRSARRGHFTPSYRLNDSLGFRVGFKQINNTPSNLLSPAPLTIVENQPVGTVVGEFNATDPDAGATLTYHLVSGAGDGNNSLFTLETNGTLKTANTFDYESNASTYSIRVQAKDEFNATVEGNFTVVLTDVYEPSQANHFVDLNSSVNLEMIWVEPGTFTMGSPTGETGRNASKEQEHNVTLTKGFYLGKYEVTQAHYEAVMTGNGSGLSATPSSYFGNPNRPVERVSWDDVQIFLTRLNANEQAAGRLPTGWSYVLPTESQWEYACRAGTTTVYSWGNTITSAHANYSSTGIGQTSDVGQYAANPWGFFDMHGNVWEMLSDWYQSGYPTDNPSINPEGPVVGSAKVHRGGSFVTGPVDLRSAERHSYNPANVHNTLGFRLAYKQITTAPNNLASTTPLTFAENQPIGTVVSDFNATDPDAGATLTYYLVSGTGDGNNTLFTLETNGTLKTATTFDYETNASTYTIRVQAKDEHNATVEGNFTVTLTDVYEAPPNTPPTNLTTTTPLTIAENRPVGTIVGEFNATDPDAGASLTYYLVSGSGDGGNSQFSLDANGTLRTATVFDYERNASTYSIRVRVRDNHLSTLDGVFTITLRDVFENTVPSDLNATASLTVAENQPVGTIVGEFNATDPDAGASLTYHLVSGAGDGGNSNFSLDANGTLRTATVFDYERNASTYSIRVRAKDNHSSTLEGVFTVRLTDQNDGPSGLVPLATLSVPENEPAGTVVGAFKTSVPVAGMQVSYRLVAGDGDSDNAYFVMDPDGTLKTAYPLDYEADTFSYSIRVRAEEPTGAGVEKIFLVRLRDVLVPVVETGGVSTGGSVSATDDSLVLEGRILVAGGGAGVTDRGILFSSKPNPSFESSDFDLLQGGAGEGVFQVRTSRVEPGRKYYYRAYATNAEGTSYGLEESFRTIEKGTKPGWVLAERTSGQNVDEYTYLGEHGKAPNWTGVQAGTIPNWWKSDLMGTFFQAPNGWALHPDFGWFYPVRSQSRGVWLWKRNQGWFWTDMGLYPRLYRSNSQGWVYFYGVWQGRKLFYDYASGKWTTIEEQ